MELQPSPYIDNELPPVGVIDMGVSSDLTQTAPYYCSSSSGCKQRLYKKRPPYPSWIYFAGITFTTLAAIYFLLGCFDFLRGKPSVVGLARSLADGGEGPCQGGGHTGEEKERGGAEATSGSGDAAEGAVGDDGQQARAPAQPPQWDIKAPSLFEESARRIFPGGAGTATLRVGFSMESPHQGESAVGVESAQTYQPAQEISGHGAKGTLEPNLGGAVRRGDDGSPLGVASEEGLREGEDWELWANRGLPPYAEAQVVGLFERMLDDACLCQSLLPILGPREGLLLAYQVVRLLTLDLGAIALVQQHIEIHRLQLGNALIALGVDALKRSGEGDELEEHRAAIRELMLLTEKLKQPRPFTENTGSIKYRKKMTSILRTAECVESFCFAILNELATATERWQRLATNDFERHLRALKALYRVHSNYIAKDSSLRYYIVQTQEHLNLSPLLGPHHHKIANEKIPPLLCLVEEISEAVRNSGGLQLTPQITDLPQRRIARGNALPATGRVSPPHAQSHQLRGHAQQQEGFMHEFLPSLASGGSPTFQTPEAMDYPIASSHAQSLAVPFGQLVPDSHASARQPPSGVDLETLRTLELLPFDMPWGNESSHGIQGSRSHLPHTPTAAGSAAAQSHQAAAPFAQLQQQPQIWLRGQQAVQGSSSTHSGLLPPTRHEGHHSQASPSAFPGPELSSAVPWTHRRGQLSQPGPPSPPWKLPFAGRPTFLGVQKGADSAGASISVAEKHVPSSHGPAAASHPGHPHLRHDIPATQASVQPSEGDSYKEYSLFGETGRPPWLPASAVRRSAPMHKFGGAIQRGEDEGSPVAQTSAGGFRSKDSASRGSRDSSDR
ncbi:hypothetical protein, conserved [Eimeria brunetti]|uniref:Transmembrane protein n=1 Tax=Eimeria brunetti TaxID=51314 RepID=U6LMW7_9EIME|nr:hypothetical protein, conserved [Eimeria brunetti]